jgi:hypothetical protein
MTRDLKNLLGYKQKCIARETELFAVILSILPEADALLKVLVKTDVVLWPDGSVFSVLLRNHRYSSLLAR